VNAIAGEMKDQWNGAAVKRFNAARKSLEATSPYGLFLS